LILGVDADAAREFKSLLSLESGGEAGKRGEGRRVEMTARAADGSEFPVEASISRIGTGEAEGFTGFFRDITERTRAGRRGALLKRELDHRVKNNLSTVIAILGETARRCESVPDLVRRASGRIRALAGLHEMLAAQKWDGAEVKELVSRTLAPYQTEGRGRILIAGEPTRIPGRAASALCMALHELATNAAKYGSLSSSAGSAEVSWKREERAGGEEGITLTWRESGGPPVRPPAQRGFGTELIENGIAFETGGSSTLEFAPGGIVCTIQIPLREEMDPVEPLERIL
jgi:two-component sensor histidine kinase